MFTNAKFSDNQTYLRYEAPKLWNMLENKVKNVTYLNSFKQSINL